MPKALIVYGSFTGNTESAALLVADILRENGISALLKDAADVEAESLARDCDLTILGCSTWGDEEMELQADFIPLYESLDQAGLAGRPVAVFGCGDSSYTHFCGAVDAISARLEEIGARPLVEPLKIDGEPRRPEVAAWAQELCDHVR